MKFTRTAARPPVGAKCQMPKATTIEDATMKIPSQGFLEGQVELSLELFAEGTFTMSDWRGGEALETGQHRPEQGSCRGEVLHCTPPFPPRRRSRASATSSALQTELRPSFEGRGRSPRAIIAYRAEREMRRRLHKSRGRSNWMSVMETPLSAKRQRTRWFP